MIPTDICLIDAIPVNQNGKIDYPRLARLLAEAERTASDPPRSAIERVVAQVWCTILGRDHVGRSDSFINLGSSLEAMRIALDLSRLFAAEVPLLWIYEAPTVQQLANWLESSIEGSVAMAEKLIAASEEQPP